MKIREWMNNNPAIMTIGAVVLLIICLGVIVNQLRGPGTRARTIDVYYYDLNTGELFVTESDQIPPIDTDSGAEAGVLAYVYSCTDCSDESSRKIGFLQKYSKEAKQMLVDAGGEPPDDPRFYEVVEMNGQLVKRVEDQAWVPINSEQGYEMMEQSGVDCPEGQRPIPCYPGR